MIRGRKTEPSKNEIEFWVEFNGLLFDDMEVPYNDLVAELRNIAQKYWERKYNKV